MQFQGARGVNQHSAAGRTHKTNAAGQSTIVACASHAASASWACAYACAITARVNAEVNLQQPAQHRPTPVALCTHKPLLGFADAIEGAARTNLAPAAVERDARSNKRA